MFSIKAQHSRLITMSWGIISMLLSGAFLWLGIVAKMGKWSGQNARISIFCAASVFGVIVVALTEGLSFFHALTPFVAARTWGVICSLSFLWLLAAVLSGQRNALKSKSFLIQIIWNGRSAARRELNRLMASPMKVLFWIVVGAWLAILFIIAFWASPNNYDSMTYRLPRVMHWAQNQSVEFYPTEILRQNHRAPFAEWILLHAFLLTGGDRFFNMLQWAALLGCSVAVYELAAVFTRNRAARCLAVLLAITMPMAVLQATGTQSDLVASFFFLVFLIFGLRMSRISEAQGSIWFDAIFCGLALGLSLLTRSPNFLYAGIFSLWFGVRLLSRFGLRALPAGGLCGLLVVMILLGHTIRNYQLFGRPLGPEAQALSRSHVDHDGDMILVTDTNVRMNLRFLASNLMRNAAMHLQTPVHNVNTFIERMLHKAHDAIGLTTAEPEITWPGTSPDLSYLRHEDVAGNLPQMLLFLAAIIALPFRSKYLASPLKIYGFCLVLAFVLFSCLLRWEPWHTRIELPLFFALCPFVVAVLNLGNTQLGAATAAVGICYGLPFLLDNENRPLFGDKSIMRLSRESQYFRADFETSAGFREAARVLKSRGYWQVGLVNDVDSFHYPLWPLYRKNTSRNLRFYEVKVSNDSRLIAMPPSLDAVVVTYPMEEASLHVQGTRYEKIWSGGQLAIFEAAP